MAVTDRLVLSESVQAVAVLESQPDQVTVVAPVPMVALSVTVESNVKRAEQVLGQLIPVGELVTVPLPVVVTVNAA